jgi:NAD(P)-dependent dehydrogenase (short-subunit alcohol dehydrogenase family)
VVVDLPEESWDTVLDTNLKGTFITSQAVARSMLDRACADGSSACVPVGKKGGARRAAYCASKFGIIGFTQSLAQELASAGITVNAICPSAAETERLDHMGLRADGSFDAAQRAERIKQTGAATPLGRIARRATSPRSPRSWRAMPPSTSPVSRSM